MRSFRRRLSLLVGWLADRHVPRLLRAPLYGLFARITGADAAGAELPPVGYPSLGAFFVRRLAAGVRPIDPGAGRLVSPCDGELVALERVRPDGRLTVKGRAYTVDEVLAGAGGGVDLEGGWAWTIYLGPKDYHRVHAPLAARLGDVRWVPGDRRSVSPTSLARHERVLATNERAVMRLESEETTVLLVMVGALNVGRIRVLGVERGASPPAALAFDRGGELARFELGSTVVLLVPPGSYEPLPDVEVGAALRMGRAIGASSPARVSAGESREPSAQGLPR